MKLLEALRKGDQAALHPFLSNARNDRPCREGICPLHMAVRCAEFSVIEFCLDYKSIHVNAIDADNGNTALHIASSSGRDDVVQLLLDQDEIDDTKRNFEGKDALDVAKSPEIAQIIQVSRAQLNARFLELLNAYEKGPESAEADLFAVLELPRFSAIDLNAHSARGSTLLHEAVKRKDTRMIEMAVRKGADVFSRDRRGKRVGDMTKDEKIKALLRQLTNADAARQSQGIPGQAPSFKGYMGKWTNIAGGYKTRWFVLENGILSYYHSQDDEGKQSRGAINMRFATIRADNNDKHRLEIISETGKGTSKLYLRGTHPVERARWVQVLQQTKEFFNLDKTPSRTESLYQHQAPSTSSLSAGAAGHNGSNGNAAAPASQTPLSPLTNQFNKAAIGSSTRGGMLAAKPVGSGPPASGRSSERSLPLVNRSPSILSKLSSDERDDADSLGEDGVGKGNKMPHEHEFPLTAEALKTQAELSHRLADSLFQQPATGSDTSSLDERGTLSRRNSNRTNKSSFRASLSSTESTRTALASAIKSTAQLVERYQKMVADREEYMQRQYERELQIKHLWEENMKVLAQQHAEMEASLKEAAEENARKRKALREVRETMGSSPGSVISPIPGQGSLSQIVHNREPSRQATAMTQDSFATPPSSLAARRLGETGTDSASQLRLNDTPSPPLHAQQRSIVQIADNEHVRSSVDDADDEFFDAIESGNLPGMKVEEPLEKTPNEGDWPEHFDKKVMDEKALEPYRHLRQNMPIGKDDRPSVSLWAILKNNIGKDLTKISFPVSFNEPTSMLQRMAEDMEFSECLDAASLQEDSTKRIAFVAAFAMSNYSSTIGRIAKPFNPLLGETFEYVRLDKKYRYVSEQVSHHPPISACYAQSPSWEYMGCVDAKSKFLGRTFEIRPTGVAHVNLKIPSGWIDTDKDLPRAETSLRDDMVLEHYTWNKVTTSVSGFIVGSPTIDHFGDMEVTNHATGDKCILTFKPRGWRGKDAFEIRGMVYDKHGNLAWDIAGRWNSQLVARKVGAGSGDLNPDQQVSAPGGEIATAQPTAEYMLLWRNSEKPSTPFNLTP